MKLCSVTFIVLNYNYDLRDDGIELALRSNMTPLRPVVNTASRHLSSVAPALNKFYLFIYIFICLFVYIFIYLLYDVTSHTKQDLFFLAKYQSQ